MVVQQAKRNTEDVGRAGELDKRNAIVDAARDLFTTDGYENTTIAHVAKRARVAVGTVYLYFKNKTDLLIAVKGDWEQEVLRSLLRPDIASLPFHLRARPMIEASFEICTRHSNMVQLMGVQMETVGDWTAKAPAPIFEALRGFLEEGIALGAIRKVDPATTAVAVYGMVNGALQQCFVVENGERKAEYIDTLVDAITHWLVNPDLL